MYVDSKLITDVLFSGSLQYFHKVELEELNYVIQRTNNAKIIDLKDYSNEKTNLDSKIIYFDHPDLLIVNKDFVIAVEHFKVNASKKSKKGYSYSHKYNKRYFDEKYISNKKNITEGQEFSSLTDQVSTELKYENLFDNVIDVFTDHYKKIDSYKNNIRISLGEPLIKIYTIFFIEYDVQLPSFIIENNAMKSVFPHNDIQFYSKIKNKTKIEGILVYQKGSSNQNEIKRYISISGVNSELNKIDNNNVYDFGQIEIHDFSNPMMNHFVVKIEK